MKMKFKVGDKVIGNKEASKIYSITREGWAGAVVSAHDNYFEARHEGGARFMLDYDCFDLSPEKKKSTVIITTDGHTTTARLKDGKKTVKEAKSVCCPSDTFNQYEGARIALERLFDIPAVNVSEPQEPKYWTGTVVCVDNDDDGGLTNGKVYDVTDGVMCWNDGTPMRWRFTSAEDVNAQFAKSKVTNAKFSEVSAPSSAAVREVKRQAKAGEWVKFTDYHGGDLEVGSIFRVREVRDTVYFYKTISTCCDPSLYVVLEGYTPPEADKPAPAKTEEPKYYGGKVVCLKDSVGFTGGKVYTFKNGCVLDDEGDLRPSSGCHLVKSLDEWNSVYAASAAFIEYKGEHSKNG